MQTMMVPKGLCDEIERIVWKFVWGSNNGNAKVALVSWDSMCQPKAHRGLGLRHLKDHNTSFMMNVGFNIVSNVNALWVRVLRTKYGISSGLLENLSRGHCSFLWRSIAKVWPFIHENLVWSVGDVWGATSIGSFSLKSAYGKIRGGALNPKERIWELPWTLKGPQRICFFLWLAFKHRLLTNAKRVMRGIGNNNSCGFCG
ncbi:hypothetical protein PVK06_023577 [Gossypium arboreum]|uniref:Reverse transcriptase zinc-binding domain-containing protein n=1 Tax=Gossypium arboreum TaxID=29729 RepID=A0ABR0PBJ0_GOSAR|nr:hypothetical protein PVK06_023577 [Gossypium arboreum]